jgi:hypothetical protein
VVLLVVEEVVAGGLQGHSDAGSHAYVWFIAHSDGAICIVGRYGITPPNN